jgi:uncharacterized protein
MANAAPVSKPNRIETLDVLRGFALLGILTMNIRAMAAPLSSYMYPAGLFEYTGASRLAYLFTSTVSDLKMMGLFSMLFGASVLLYATKTTATGDPPRALWFRRMAWLLVFGMVHAYLIWGGDILVPYALCGMLILWWVRRLPAGALLAASMLVLAIGAALTVAHGLEWESLSEAERAPEAAIMKPTPEQAQADLQWMLAPYTQAVIHDAPVIFMFQTLMFVAFFLWRCSGMMLLGMALYKWGFLDGSRSTSTYARTAAVCLPVGLSLCAYGALEIDRTGFALPERIILDLWNYAGAVLVSVGYAAIIILAIKHDILRGVRHALGAVGQMALTNYLATSIVTSALFKGWGLGLAGRFDYAEQLIVVAAIWTVQLLASPMWLARYQFGPAEWLWRSLTYGSRQPLLRGRPSLGSAVAGA